MTILTYNITLKPFIFDNCKNFFLKETKKKYIFIDYPDSSNLYKKFFYKKINYKFITHNDFIKFKKKDGINFLPDLEFYKKNIFSEKIFMAILSRYQVEQNTFSYLDRQNYYKDIIKNYGSFLIKNNVTKIIFYDYPHQIDSYILYIIAKYLKIKIIIISYLFLLGNYRVVIDVNLKDRFSQFFKKQNYRINEKKILEKIHKYSKSDLHLKPHYILSKNSIFYLLIKDLYRSFKRGFFNDSNFYAKKNHKLNYLNEKPISEISSVKINFFQRNKIKKLEKNYLRLCTNYNSKRYILFLPSVQPEASSLPLAGFFHDFNLILDMLIKHLPNNWHILYKEHPLTFSLIKESHLFKNDNYYELLKNNKIQFIDHRLDTYKFITKSQCIATSTGSAGLEASLKGKPVLNFGLAWWSNFNNIFKIQSDTDLKSAINCIVNKKFKFNSKNLTKNILDTYKKTVEFEFYNENSFEKYNIKKSKNKVDFRYIENYFKKNHI